MTKIVKISATIISEPLSILVNGKFQNINFPENGKLQNPKFPVSTSREEALPRKISMKREMNKGLYALKCSTNKELMGHMLFSETSAAAFLLARFRGLARVPSSVRVPGVAHPCPRIS